MPTYFELYNLPVSFTPDQAAVKSRYYELSRQHHPDRFAHTGGAALVEAMQQSALNNEAYKTLRDADATMAYILRINDLLEHDEKYALPPAFLMEMMDLNEAISDAEADPANAAARTQAAAALQEQLDAWQQTTRQLIAQFTPTGQHAALLLKIKDQYFRKKYLLRIKERIDRFATR